MRILLAIVVATTALVAQAADPGKVQGDNQPPTADQIESLMAERLSKLIPKLGVPIKVDSARSGDDSDLDYVKFAYDGFSVWVHDSTIECCEFRPDWKGPVHGIAIGDSVDSVVKILGTNYQPRDGQNAYLWNLPQAGATLWVFWDAGKKKVDHIRVWIK